MAVSCSLAFGTAGPPPVALHPASRRRSYLQLLSRNSLREEMDFHRLIPCICNRTETGIPACFFQAGSVNYFIRQVSLHVIHLAPPRSEASVSNPAPKPSVYSACSMLRKSKPTLLPSVSPW